MREWPLVQKREVIRIAAPFLGSQEANMAPRFPCDGRLGEGGIPSLNGLPASFDGSHAARRAPSGPAPPGALSAFSRPRAREADRTAPRAPPRNGFPTAPHPSSAVPSCRPLTNGRAVSPPRDRGLSPSLPSAPQGRRADGGVGAP